jgi:hypothetical protein
MENFTAPPRGARSPADDNSACRLVTAAARDPHASALWIVRRVPIPENGDLYAIHRPRLSVWPAAVFGRDDQSTAGET